MKRPHGIGLLLLAITLLLVTLGVTLTVGNNVMLTLELALMLIVQFLVFIMLFAEGKWDFAHLVVFIIGILVIAFLAQLVLSKTVSNLEVLLLIALNLAGFLITVISVPQKKPMVIPKTQTKLDSYDRIQTYNLQDTTYYQPTVRVTKAKKTVRNAKKKTVKKKKTAKKKTVRKTAKKASKKAVRKTTRKKTAKKATKRRSRK